MARPKKKASKGKKAIKAPATVFVELYDDGDPRQVRTSIEDLFDNDETSGTGEAFVAEYKLVRAFTAKAKMVIEVS